MTLTPEVLEELERLEREATPAPWRAGTSDTDCVFGCMGDGSLMAPPLGRVLMRTNLHFPVYTVRTKRAVNSRGAL